MAEGNTSRASSRGTGIRSRLCQRNNLITAVPPGSPAADPPERLPDLSGEFSSSAAGSATTSTDTDTDGGAQIAKPRRTHLNPNRIRDHLANERTYLSWMRSGISLLGFGVLIVRIRVLSPPLAPQATGNGWKLGVAFSVVGLITVALSSWHYFAVRDDIENDDYAPSDRWVLLSSLVIFTLGVFVVFYVFNVPSDFANTVLVD